MILRTLVAAGVMAASLGAMAGPAAARDICNGVQETDGCEYCTAQGSALASSTYYCEAGYSGFYWAGCRWWINGVCLTGAID